MKKAVCLLILLFFSLPSYSQGFKFITHELKPFTWKNDKSGAMQGIVYEICEETIMRMGYKNPEIKVLPFVRALKAVQKEKNCVVFHIARNLERENTMKWVGPIISTGVYFYKNKNTKYKAETIEDFKKLKNIGVGRANASHKLLINQGFKNLYDLTNEIQAVQMLESNRVDAVPVGELVLNDLAEKAVIDISKLEKTKVKLTESVLYIGFSKNISDTEIQNWQNAFESVMREKYEILYKKYISNEELTTK